MELVIKSHGAFLGYRRGLIVVRRGNTVEKVPMAEVRRIWILTSGVSVSSRLVRAAARSLVDIVYLDHRGTPVARVFPPEPNGTVAHKRAQYRAYYTGRGMEFARRATSGKIANQASALRRIAKSRVDHAEGLRSMAAHIAPLAARVLQCGDAQCVMAYEGEAAQAYWEALKPLLRFPGRDPDGGDPVNMALNYGYGLLRAEVWRQAVLHGLDPYAGYLHADRSGRPSLVLDLMEEFRPAVDLMVYRLRPGGDWAEAGRLTYDARKRLVEAWLAAGLERDIARQARALVRFLEGEAEYVPWRL